MIKRGQTMKFGYLKHFTVLFLAAVALTYAAMQIGGSWTRNVETSVAESLAAIQTAAGEKQNEQAQTETGDHNHSDASHSEASDKEPSTKAASAVTIGAEFSLTDHNGNTFTHEDLKGKYSLVFFGFTNCPDVCPAGLTKMATALKSLGTQGNRVTPVFITIDPGRDTPEVMNEYVQQFHPNMVGLTGEKADLKAVQNGYKVYSAREETGDHDGAYMMNHSAYTYFMGPDGEFITIFSSKDVPADMAWEMKKIMREKSQG